MVVKRYTIIFGASAPALVDEVCLLIQKGWMPAGGISYDPTSDCFMQAMIEHWPE